MSEPNPPGAGRGAGGAAEEEQVRQLLQQAGPRPAVPAEDLAAIKAAFRATWQEQVRQERLRREPARRLLPRDRRLWALAAAVVAAVGLGWWLWSRGGPAGAGPAARVESAAGEVTVRVPGVDGGDAAARLAVGDEVPAGAELETAGDRRGTAGRAALRLAGGAALRLDAGSRVRLVSASAVELARGAVYVDSGPGRRGSPGVEVRTPLAVAREIGTQFEVRLLEAGAAVRVRVREGAVRLEADAASHSAAAGVELTLSAGGAVTRRPIAGHGEPWRWVVAAAPPLQIEGLTLQQFLDQVARETGLRIEYADPALAAAAPTIRVHGRLGDLTPEEAPAVVLPGAGLEHRIQGGTLLISATDEP